MGKEIEIGMTTVWGRMFKIVLLCLGFGVGWYGRGRRGMELSGRPKETVADLKDGRYHIVGIHRFPSINPNPGYQNTIYYYIFLEVEGEVRAYRLPTTVASEVIPINNPWDSIGECMMIDRSSSNTIIKLVLRPSPSW